MAKANSAQAQNTEQQYEVTLEQALELAQGHHRAGNVILAERTYRDILRAVPDHYPATHHLGVLLFQTGNFDESRQFLARATGDAPDDKICWNNYGAVLMQLKLYDEALSAYDRALAIDPEYVDALCNRAYVLWLTEKYKEAEQACLKVLELSPEHPIAMNTLGITLARRIRYEESVDVWEKLTALYPEDALAWANWGNCLREMGKLQLAEEKCKKAVDLDPKNPEALNNLANILRDTGKLVEAIDLYRKATNERPDYYQAHNNLAIALIDNGCHEEAAVAARYAIAFKNDFADAYSALSHSLRALGDYERANGAALRALHLKPGDTTAYLELASILIYIEQLDDAVAALREALRREPNSPRTYMQLAEVYESMNDPDLALAAIDKGLEMSPDMPALWVRKSMIHYDEIEMDKALECADKAISLAPKWHVPKQQKAEMLISLGKNDEAEKLVREILSVTKDFPGPYYTLTGVKKFQSEDDEDLLSLLAMAKKVPGLGVEAESLYHFALADIYEDIKKYDLAFEHLKKANELSFRTVPRHRIRSEEVFTNLKGRFTPEHFAQVKDKGCDSTLPVFIVGMPRSGTTLTEQIISSHPEVYGAGELPDLGKVHRHYLLEEITDPRLLGEDYVRRIKARDKSGKARYITDKMPGNYMHIGLIATILPNAKIIHCRRNPIDTCLSCYKQNFARGQFWSYDLDELAAEYKRYLDLMEYWRTVLPGRILDVDYEDTVGNTEKQARRMLDYLGLEWNDACLEPHKQERAVLTASKGQVSKPIYKTSVQKWKIYEKQLQPLVRALMPEEALPDEAA